MRLREYYFFACFIRLPGVLTVALLLGHRRLSVVSAWLHHNNILNTMQSYQSHLDILPVLACTFIFSQRVDIPEATRTR